MIRRYASSALLVLLTASLGTSLLACKKDTKDDGAAAVDAAPVVEVAVADAAPEPVADAADDAADSAVEPLDSGPAPKVVRKAPPDPPICVAARSAKKRGSPAAAGLAAQCTAAGGKL